MYATQGEYDETGTGSFALLDEIGTTNAVNTASNSNNFFFKKAID
jgi:hypothetical protein